MSTLPLRFMSVTEVSRVTPRMVRVTFGGDDLADFGYQEPDQQVKLYFPRPGQNAPRLPEAGDDFMSWYQAFGEIPADEQPWTRSYTLRAHDPDSGRIVIDFVLHDDAGPATRWAASASPGDTLGMFGPSALFARKHPLRQSIEDGDWLLVAGDETALPAIGSIVESLPAGKRALVFVEVTGASEEQRFTSAGDISLVYLHRDGVQAGHSSLLVDAVRAVEFLPGNVFAWLAAEAGVVRSLRRNLVERGVAKRSIEFTGHWRLKLTQDDAPTEEDLAEAQERLVSGNDG